VCGGGTVGVRGTGGGGKEFRGDVKGKRCLFLETEKSEQFREKSGERVRLLKGRGKRRRSRLPLLVGILKKINILLHEKR